MRRCRRRGGALRWWLAGLALLLVVPRVPAYSQCPTERAAGSAQGGTAADAGQMARITPRQMVMLGREAFGPLMTAADPGKRRAAHVMMMTIFALAQQWDSAAARLADVRAADLTPHDSSSTDLMLATLQTALWQRDAARATLARRAQRLRRADMPEDSAARLLEVATLRLRLGDSADAHALFVRAAARALAVVPGELGTAAMAEHNVALLWNAHGAPDSAMAHLEREFAHVIALRTDCAALARVLTGVGLVHARRGQADSAIAYFTEALAQHRAAGRTGESATVLGLIGVAEAARGRHAAALDGFRRSAWLRESDGLSFRSFDDLRLAVQEGDAADAGGLSIAGAWARSALRRGGMTDTLEAWAALERSRARALLALRAPPSLAAPDSAGMVAPWRAMGSLLQRLHRPGRAVVTYDHWQDTLLILGIAPDGRHVGVRVGITADSLAALVRGTRALFGATGLQRGAVGTALPAGVRRSRGDDAAEFSLDPRATGPTATALLSAALLPAALARLVADASELLIVPDGLLSLVPWAALPVGAAGTPLGATLAIRLTPSLALLDDATREQHDLPRASRRTIGARALIIGDPAMPSGTPSLPGARREVRWLADTVLRGTGARALVGREATVAATLARMPDATLLHFATHAAAFPEPGRARASYLQLAADDPRRPSVLTAGTLIALAEDRAFRLSARLVVLSACETGVGAVLTTEGVLGLQRAFLSLGARAMLVSLWKVDDGATRAMMQRFYAHWLDDPDAPSAAAALHRAQTDLRTGRVAGWTPAWASPRAWAAFQLVGAD